MMKKSASIFVGLVFLLGLAWVPGTTGAQDTVEITFVHIFPDERDIRRSTIEEIAAEFMELNPGVVINIQTTTDKYLEVFDAALLAAEQGNAPQLVQVEDTFYQLAIDSGYFVRIGDYSSEAQLASMPDILDSIRNYYGMDQAIWGLPWNASNPTLYYNPDMLAAAGLDPNNPPSTFEEITAACDAIMSAEIENLQTCINWPVTSWLLEQWVSMQNTLFVDNDNGHSGTATEVFLESDAVMNVINWWKALSDSGYYAYSGRLEDYYAEGLMFVTKRTAMHISTSSALSNILAFSETMGKFPAMVAPLPMPDASATNGITMGGGTLWVTAGHSEAETRAAVDFAYFLISTENDKRWHQVSGYFPIRTSSIDQLTEEGWFDENPFYSIALNQLMGTTPNAANAGAKLGAYIQVREAVNQAIQSVLDQGEDPAEAMAAAKVIADSAIAEYNSIMGN